jgi:predicted exporter
MSLGFVNILQIFMLFVIVSLSIDYGIYMSQKGVSIQTQRAILFSLMSTFAGFGVLVFSSIGVLFYIGEVATLGLLAIFILLFLGEK